MSLQIGLVDAATLAGGATGVASLVLTAYIFLRARGRLYIDAQFLAPQLLQDQQIELLDKQILVVLALNKGQEIIQLKSIGVEFRPQFPSLLTLQGLRDLLHMKWVTVELLDTVDWVEVGPGRRHTIWLPLLDTNVLTSLYAISSLDKKYHISRWKLLALRLQRHRIKRAKHSERTS